jgi:ribosomal protein S18 acetylase RimI-like enzyme
MLKEQSKTKSIEDRFIVRPPEMSDLDDVLELLEICSLTMLGEVEASAEMLKTDWTNPIVDRSRNFRIVATRNGRVIAYAELWDDHDPLVRIWFWARVHPDFEGQGIGTYLIDWAEALATESMVKAPAKARFTIETGAPSTYGPAIDLLEARGMKRQRQFYDMEIELDDQPDAPRLLENITIRPMKSNDELPAVIEAIQDSFRDHWGFVEQSPENELAFWTHVVETDANFNRDLWFLAMDGDEIAGISLCWPNHGGNEKKGWVGTLGVRRPWRRQGLGLALLKHSFNELYRLGKNKVGLGVDADSLTGATRLYEKAGMHVARQFDQYEKELRPGIDMATRTTEG